MADAPQTTARYYRHRTARVIAIQRRYDNWDEIVAAFGPTAPRIPLHHWLVQCGNQRPVGFSPEEFDRTFEKMPKPDQTTIPPGIHRGDLGMQRARIAPLLTGEDLAELLALADFCICAEGSLHFGKQSDLMRRLKALRLIEWTRPPDLSRDARLTRLTKLGWLTLLTRAEGEMRHLLPVEELDDAA